MTTFLSQLHAKKFDSAQDETRFKRSRLGSPSEFVSCVEGIRSGQLYSFMDVGETCNEVNLGGGASPTTHIC